MAFVVVDGRGDPEGEQFAAAIGALYSISYGAHFLLKRATGAAPRVMGLEALWWVEGADAQSIMERFATGGVEVEQADRDRWCWRAMIMQLPGIDETLVAKAIDQARAKADAPALAAACFLRWAEGPSAQILHVGPYATEQTSLVTLHAAIAEHGSQPRGRHHEIYLGDPRRAAPEKLRTILRQPIEARG